MMNVDVAAWDGGGAGAAGAIGGNRVRLSIDATQFRSDVIADIAKAQDVVNVEMYGWRNNGSGAAIADALKGAARRGVEVNVLVDGNGARLYPMFPSSQRFIDDMRAAGIAVQVGRRPNLGAARGLMGRVREVRAAAPEAAAKPRVTDAVRDVMREVKGGYGHRKFFSIDNRVGYVGGFNLSERFDAWHDVMARIEGPAVRSGNDRFLDRWRALGGQVSQRHADLLSRPVAQPAANATAAVRILTNDPTRASFEASDQWMSELATAKKSFWVQSPFITSPEMVEALADAARRPGMDVRVLVPASDGHPSFLLGLTKSHYRDLLKAGVQIYEQPEFTHSKVWLADGRPTVSSLNIGHRSFRLDHEMSAAISDAALGEDLTRHFQKDFAAARRVDISEVDTLGWRAIRALRSATRIRI